MLLRMIGGLCMFLFGMKLMSDGMQEGASGAKQRVCTRVPLARRQIPYLNNHTLTALRRGWLILGANIGTTLTAWIVSIVFFEIAEPVLPEHRR
jgi:phosphate:Na+ symporter